MTLSSGAEASCPTPALFEGASGNDTLLGGDSGDAFNGDGDADTLNEEIFNTLEDARRKLAHWRYD